MRKESSRRNHKTKIRLSYHVSILELPSQHHWNSPPLRRSHCTQEIEKPALCTQAIQLRSKPRLLRAFQRKHHLEHNDTSPDLPPIKATPHSQELFTVLLLSLNWGVQQYKVWFPDFNFPQKKTVTKKYAGKL